MTTKNTPKKTREQVMAEVKTLRAAARARERRRRLLVRQVLADPKRAGREFLLLAAAGAQAGLEECEREAVARGNLSGRTRKPRPAALHAVALRQQVMQALGQALGIDPAATSPADQLAAYRASLQRLERPGRAEGASAGDPSSEVPSVPPCRLCAAGAPLAAGGGHVVVGPAGASALQPCGNGNGR